MFGAEAHEAHDAAQGVDSDSVPDRSAFWTMRTPVIGAINGAAVGAGLTVPMLFDLRIVAEDAKLGFVFTRRGIVPDANICWLLPRLVGVERALDLLVSGRMFSGAEAVEMGLALKAVPKDQVLAEAQALAREIAVQSAPAAAGLVKQLVYEFLGETDRKAAFAKETKVIWWVGRAARRHGGDHVVPREAHPGVDHVQARRAPRGPASDAPRSRSARSRPDVFTWPSDEPAAPRQPVRRRAPPSCSPPRTAAPSAA